MCTPVDDLSSWSLGNLEASLLPRRGTTMEKVAGYGLQFFQFCVFLPLSAVLSTTSFLVNRAVRWISPAQLDPLTAFSEKPSWGAPLRGVPLQKSGAPLDIGFSTADIQDSGPDKAQFRETNWGRFYQTHKQEIGSLQMLPDALENPQKLIDEYRELGLSHFRTSISLMPKEGKSIDAVMLRKYCRFFEALERAGIKTMVTLNHFVNPEDLDWTDPKSIDRFVEYAKQVAGPLHRAGVRQILTFNEPAVYAFQGWVMGGFPPHKKFDVDGAGQCIENMMRGHQKAYHALKAEHPDFEIGLTHDPIRFRNYHDWNPLWAPQEKAISHYLTEICHGAIMRFFETGKFSLKVPFMGNHTFEIPAFDDAKTRPLDFIGLQYYTDPLLQLPWGSVTDVEGEKLSSYQYRMFPQGLASAIQEFSRLGVPIHLTEIGIDTGVNHNASDKDRIAYFEKVFQTVQKAIDCGANIKSLYWWTKDRSWEWHEGMKVDFSWCSEKGPRPVANWLKQKVAASSRAQEAM